MAKKWKEIMHKKDTIKKVTVKVKEDGNFDVNINEPDPLYKMAKVTDPNAKIVVVVAETANYGNIRYKMEPGRMAAQVGHVVSKLKLRNCLLENGKNVAEKAFEYLTPITTIVLAARDSNELKHIGYLAAKANLSYVCFDDENPKVYGVEGSVMLTAVAIGPVTNDMVFGITDYLPLLG